MRNTLTATPDVVQQFTRYLYARREAILFNWRTLCAADVDLHSRTNFSREEFNDQVPSLLNVLSQRLLGEDAQADALERAGQHGLHRWQRGYSFRELLTELNNLYLTLHNEVGQYLQLYPDTPNTLIYVASREILHLISQINLGSVIYYGDLRQTSAAEQVQTLQVTVDQLKQLSQQRVEHLRETTHDLKGSFGIASGAATLLMTPAEESDRQHYQQMLNRNLVTAYHLLDQLTDYARLEAGQERLNIKSFDAAELLRTLVEGSQGFAQQRRLALWGDGPEQLQVVSDPLKIQRIVQNLVVNALKYTTSGWVSVSWTAENDARWLISVQDTGPGLGDGPVGTLAKQLKPLNEPIAIYPSEGRETNTDITPETRVYEHDSESSDGEGIGLFIVKRLCELLKASMDIETDPAHGTLIRIRLLIDQKQPELEGHHV